MPTRSYDVADEQQFADQATTTLVETLVRLTEHAPGASRRRGDHGSALVLTRSPLPTFNCVYTTRHEVDVAEVGRFARVLADRDRA
jgi:hypothetical protein